MGRKQPILAGGLLVLGLLGAAPAARAQVTDDAVCRAIDRGIEYITKLQKGDGTWGEKRQPHATQDVGHTELALFTLIYVGVHPNRDVVSKGLDAALARDLDYTYALSCRVMALANVQNQLIGPNRDRVRTAMRKDVQWLVASQGPHGGWGYTGATGDRPSRSYADLSNTQMAVLALREASLAGAEVPRTTWQRAQDLYFRSQEKDGSWSYIEGDKDAGYGSMTAAGLASVYITTDYLDLASGCPCRAGRSAPASSAAGEMDRRIDSALGWLEKNFKADENPKGGTRRGNRLYYWLYSAERVGSAAGYKYFGRHDWFKEAAAHLLKTQQKDGSWEGPYGKLVSTCFATMFLYKGRGPILYNKLQFDGAWNSHRRDLANLTHYVSRIKEQPCHWQIVNLRAPVEELHDAPVLFITPEAPPPFDAQAKQKLRRFTDTGGTILFEASCGNAAVRQWFLEFAKEVWPEWPLEKLGPDHPVFADPYPLKARPEMEGLHDGVRTFLFYAPDDISCPWHLKGYAAQGYLFNWGINLVNYATDGAPLRAKLAARTPVAADRYPKTVKAGPDRTIRLARVRHGGNWNIGANYRGFERLAALLKEKAAVTLEARDAGVEPSRLKGYDVAYVTASRALDLGDADVAALKAFAAEGGMLWLEAATGSPAADQAVQQLAARAGWQLALLPKDHPLMTGRLGAAIGHNLTAGVRFRSSLKVRRTGRDWADLYGVMAGGRLVGVYSPLDVVFALNPYEAYGCQGYESPDAAAVATNLLLWRTAGGPSNR